MIDHFDDRKVDVVKIYFANYFDGKFVELRVVEGA